MATAVEAKTGEAGERTLVFISDLHLATDPEMRDFFAQDELAALLDELTAHPEPVDLIIAGDFFDLLQLNGADREAAFRRALHLPEYATLFDRLRRFTAIPRHRTIYLVGNHDAEMGWNAPLRRYLLASGLVSEISLAYRHVYADAQGNGCLVYCEHGNDYDGINTVGDYTNPAVTPLGAHIVTDLVNYLEPLGRHAPIDAPTSIADIDNIHPLGMIPWWFLSTYFYQQVRRLTKYVLIPAAILYTLFAVIGAGSAGLTAARFGVALGARVALIARDPAELGGDCLHTGCVPSKALIHAARAHHLARDTERYGLPPSRRPARSTSAA